MRASPRPLWLAPLLLAALTFAAYAPTLGNGFVFDDDLHITENPQLAAPDAWRRIWIEGGSFQYYPLTFTAFKLQRSLWGLEPAGYHAASVVLQGACALLFAWLLLRLRAPGAWWAAALFAVHPLHVETVAWATEQKNLLCLLFALAATDRWLVYREKKNPRDYALALAAYAACLLSKTAACLLPLVFAALDWRERRKPARAELLPFLILGGAMGLVTMAYEDRLLADAYDAPSWPARLGLAGRVFWFYLGKLAWPHPLNFTYERWTLAGAAQWIAPAAALALAVWVWKKRETRGPAAALACYVLLLLPVLGLIPNNSNRFSFVADHYAYFASLPVLALVPAALERALRQKARRVAVLTILILGSAALTRARLPAFRDAEALWRDTVAKNPAAWLAWYNLGAEMAAKGRWAEAAAHSRRAAQLEPGLGAAWFQLGQASWQAGDRAGAVKAFERTVEVAPEHAGHAAARTAVALNYLGVAAAEAGRKKEAVERFQEALALDPGCASCRDNLARAAR